MLWRLDTRCCAKCRKFPTTQYVVKLVLQNLYVVLQLPLSPSHRSVRNSSTVDYPVRRAAVAEKKAGARKATNAASSQRKAGEWSEAAVRVFRERYLLKDATGVVAETPDDLAWRVAHAVASAEAQWANTGGASPDEVAEQFYSIMVER